MSDETVQAVMVYLHVPMGSKQSKRPEVQVPDILCRIDFGSRGIARKPMRPKEKADVLGNRKAVNHEKGECTFYISQRRQVSARDAKYLASALQNVSISVQC